MKLTVQACWKGGQTAADQVVQTLRDAAQMRVVDLASSPLNPAAVEELIEAGVPMTGASWEDWLAAAGQVRREMLGITSEARDVVVLLIDRPLPRRWFSIHGKGCVVIDATGWEPWVGEGRAHLAMAHLAVTNALATQMFPTMADWQAASHEEAKGCMMDLCRDKREIQAKLRAADVCASCAPTFRAAIEQGQVSAPVFRHAMDMLGGVRQGLLNANFQDIALLDVSLELRGRRPKAMLLKPLGVEVALPPAQLALYVLALRRGGRIRARQVRGEVWDQWNLLTEEFKSSGKGLRDSMHRIDGMPSAAVTKQENAFKKHVGQIRKAFQDAVGHTYLALFMEPAGGEGGIAIPEALRRAEVLMDMELERHLDERVPKR